MEHLGKDVPFFGYSTHLSDDDNDNHKFERSKSERNIFDIRFENAHETTNCPSYLHKYKQINDNKSKNGVYTSHRTRGTRPTRPTRPTRSHPNTHHGHLKNSSHTNHEPTAQSVQSHSTKAGRGKKKFWELHKERKLIQKSHLHQTSVERQNARIDNKNKKQNKRNNNKETPLNSLSSSIFTISVIVGSKI